VEIPDYPQEGFELYAEENTFHIKRLADGELLKDFDTLKVTAFISSFFELNFENIATNIPQIHKDTIFSKNPSFVFTVKDKAGKEKKLKTFIKMNEGTWVSENDKTNFYEIFDINRMYGLMDGSSDTLILQYFAFDNIIKPVSYFYDAN
jgi:S-adenosylmethionine hydrolase